MNNRVLLSALAGGVAMFLAGWVVYGMLLMDTMKNLNPGSAAVAKDPPELGGIAVSNILWGLFLALVFERWAKISTWQAGAIAGAWTSALLSASIDLSYLSMTTMFSPAGVVVDVLAGTVLGAVGGAVVGWALGYKRAA